ncbi:hypothetical protein F5Y18DRAFT_172306 [Xylariaceae sp. FL1019]|nr:hypothetical protein F5Y18DRAFT_172306 [Xylariaceae sp. FL1019]
MSAPSDPSQNVSRDLLPHAHLLSTFRYTTKAQIQPNEVTSWLMQAPKIARDTAPFYWTYLDKPPPGTIYLTWQPLQLMGIGFSTDGFIWPQTEQYVQQEVGNGIILEMHYHRAGYAPGEPFASHSRRRFRLLPPNAQNPNAPQVDPSLWIVHYGPIDNNERIPSQMIVPHPQTPGIMETRNYLHRCGQIVRKEFILSDRVNWPHVGWPREPPRQPMYPGNRGMPQAMAYPPHAQAVGPPSKRPRTSQPAHGQVNPMAGMGQGDFEDDEDTSRGDLFDLLTPRDVCISRYKQNHEWMEEILSSAYRMGQIGFADLGLGLKGELSGLTDGIFEAQGSNAVTQAPTKPATTRLDPEQAELFRKRVNARIDSTNSEIEKMKAEHDKQMARFTKNSLITTAERELRTAVDGSGADNLNLDGHHADETDEASNRWPSKHHRKVDDIVSQVEAHLNRHAEVIHDLRRIHDGGYQKPVSEPAGQRNLPTSMAGGQVPSAHGSNTMSRQPSHAGSQQSGFMMGDSDIDMGGTAAGLLDQMHTGGSSTSTPQPPMSAGPSNSGTPVNLGIPSPHPPPQPGMMSRQAGDVRMDGTDAATQAAPGQSTGTDDWVVVPKGGVTPDGMVDPHSSAGLPKAMDSSRQASATGTPGFGGDHNDFSSLEDLNTAGDALAGFGGTPGGMSDLNMEDSAFGDAFHGVDTQGGADTPVDSNA